MILGKIASALRGRPGRDGGLESASGRGGGPPEFDDGRYKNSLFARPGGLPGGAAPVIECASESPVADAMLKPARRGARSPLARALDGPDPPCLMLDTNMAVTYAKYKCGKIVRNDIHPNHREVMCDMSPPIVVTPTVLHEAKRIYAKGGIAGEVMDKIAALPVERPEGSVKKYAAVIEAEQRSVVRRAYSRTAAAWLAAKRGAGGGGSRKSRLGRICDMAANDRTIMAEACELSKRRKVVLFTSDPDLSLFDFAAKKAAGSRAIEIVGTPAVRGGA